MSETVNITVQETVENVTVTVNEVTEQVNISVNETTEQVNLTVSENSTVVIPPSLEIRIQSLESAAFGELVINDWIIIAGNINYTGNDTTIVGGQVLEGNYEGVVIYRYITDSENTNGYPTEDSFYSGFDGASLTGLITTRNV